MDYGKHSRRVKLLGALLLATLPVSCGTTTGFGGSDASFCGAARAIYWSSHDTSGTVAQVKEHNAVGKSLCGWGAKS